MTDLQDDYQEHTHRLAEARNNLRRAKRRVRLLESHVERLRLIAAQYLPTNWRHRVVDIDPRRFSSCEGKDDE